jgi:ribulose 1,5-bisphosphate synthetase/thiazole synthase
MSQVMAVRELQIQSQEHQPHTVVGAAVRLASAVVRQALLLASEVLAAVEMVAVMVHHQQMERMALAAVVEGLK